MPSSGHYRFSRFELDLVRGCLRAGDREIKLRPKAFVVLQRLVEQAGRLLSKDELMAAAWPDVHVSDDSLVQCIREIRRALDDDEQACIKTVLGRGYLFAAPVTPVEAAPSETAPPLRPPAPPRTIVWSRGRAGLAAAVAICLGVAIGVLSIRWLDGAPQAVPPLLPSVAGADDTQIELAFWQSVQASSDQRDFQSYLDQYPNGKFTALARNRLRTLVGAAARAQERQWADDAQRQAAARKVEAQRAVVVERQAAQIQHLTQAEAARRRAEADRVAALEAAVERLGAPAAAAPSPASPPVPVPEAAPPPPASLQFDLDARPRPTLEGKWAGELGIWRFAFTVTGGEISGTLSCANTVYRLRERFAGGRALDVSANRVVGRSEFPTTMGVKGDFPTLRLKPLSAPPYGCDSSQPFELRPVSTG